MSNTMRTMRLASHFASASSTIFATRSSARRAWMRRDLLSTSFALVVAATLGGCPSEPNSLEGSIDETMSLEFDRTELRRFDGVTIQLDYLKDLESGDVDIVAKVVFDTPSGGIVVDEEIDIVANNGIIERRASDNLDFPPLEQANITFSSGGSEPGPATGRFAATFDNGKTLGGTFDAELTDVDF